MTSTTMCSSQGKRAEKGNATHNDEGNDAEPPAKKVLTATGHNEALAAYLAVPDS